MDWAVRLQDMAEQAAGSSFNSCLCNLYRDGKDHVGWHADDETAYGPNATICSVSLGQARDFQFRLKADHSCKREFRLQGGDVFIMKGARSLVCSRMTPAVLLSHSCQRAAPVQHHRCGETALKP